MLDTDGDGIPDSLDRDSDNDGLKDSQEAGHDDPDTDADGDINCGVGFVGGTNGFCDFLETTPDSGVADYNSDGIGPDMPVNTDGDGAPDFQDLDSDNDGLGDLVESGVGCTDTTPVDSVCDGPVDTFGIVPSGTPGAPVNSDSDSIPDYLDLDSDNDGLLDITEVASGCLDDNENGLCDGPDLDNDGIADSIDDDVMAFGDPNGTNPPDADGGNNPGTPDYVDTDSDDDGTNDVDGVSVCVDVAPADGECDGMDTDGDGAVDPIDGFTGFGTAAPDDTDGDGIPDWSDIDDDNDGILDVDEGDGTVDTDNDGVPDSLDLDADNDGIMDAVEAGHGLDGTDGLANCSAFGPNGYCDDLETSEDGVATYSLSDSDGTGAPDFQELDSDGDTISDLVEGGSDCVDADGDQLCDGPDADGDGIADDIDNMTGHGAMGQSAPTDTDSDSMPDYQDIDSDGDTISDADEAGDADLLTPPVDTDGDGDPDFQDLDSDDDGQPDADEAGDSDLSTPPADADGNGIPDFQEGDGAGENNFAVAGGGCQSTAWPSSLLVGMFMFTLAIRRKRSL